MEMVYEAKDKRFFDLIETEKGLQVIADKNQGLEFTEGPVWSTERQRFYFNDMAGNKMYFYSDSEGLNTLCSFSLKANGNAIGRENQLITCEHVTSRIVTRNLDGGEYEVLCAYYGDKELNSPNDLVVGSDGALWFTDPPYGRYNTRFGFERRQQLNFQGLYRLKEGKLELMQDDFETPNGLCFSPDERILYVNDSQRYQIRKFLLKADGSFEDAGIFTLTQGDEPGKPDGIKVDVLGNVYVTAQGGVQVYTPQAEYLGRIRIKEQMGNLCFGDADMKSLYLCASDKIYRLRTLVAGQQVNP